MTSVLPAAFLLLTTSLSAGCSSESSDASSLIHSTGSIALSVDDSLLYVADRIRGVVHVIDVETEEERTSIPVGGAPDRLLVDESDQLWVLDVMNGALKVVARDAFSSPRTLAVATPVTAFTIEGGLAYVGTKAGDEVRLRVFDAATWEERSVIPLSSAAVALRPSLDGARVVVAMGDAGLEVVDAQSGDALITRQMIEARANTAHDEGTDDANVSSTRYHLTSATDVFMYPGTQTGHVAVSWTREDGPEDTVCDRGGLTRPGLVVLLDDAREFMVADLTHCTDGGAPTILRAPPDEPPLGAALGVLRQPFSEWLFVAHEAAISVTSTYGAAVVSQQVLAMESMGGIATSRDGLRLYAYSPSTSMVSIAQGNDGAIAVNRQFEVK